MSSLLLIPFILLLIGCPAEKKKINPLILGAAALVSNSAASTASCTVKYDWGCFTDNNNGTISFVGSGSYAGTNLVWKKCSQGQTWDSSSNSCTGTATTHAYCSATDNTCNGNADTGTLNGGGTSAAYSQCNGIGSFGGKTGWRVPTISELKSIVVCGNGISTPVTDGSNCGLSGPYINTTLFPTVTNAINFWSSNSTAATTSSYIRIDQGKNVTTGTKTSTFNVLCVTN